MTSARDSATAAKTSETNARASELSALEAKNSAEQSAEDAEYWARIAQENGGSGGGITEIPVATADTLGGIRVGEGLEITEDGVLSALGGGSGTAIETVLLDELVVVTTGYISAKGRLKNSIKNFDFVVLTTAQDVSGALIKQCSIIIDTKTIKVGDDQSGQPQWYTQSSTGTGDYNYLIAGNFGDGTQICTPTVSVGSQVASSKHYVTRVVGIKNVELLEVDDTPTEGSTNPVTSGGVHTALATKADMAYVDGKITYGTTDLTAGTSTLDTGKVYLCYE
jgi:hypothetical protein